MAVLGWLFVQWPQFREDPQDVRPLLRSRVRRLQFQGLNEVLQDDHLLGEVRLVQKLPHVRPGFDELPGLIANGVMRCLDGIELLELPLKLFPLTLQPHQSLLYEAGFLGPHLGEDSQEVVDLGLHGREPLTNQNRFLLNPLEIFTQSGKSVVDDLFSEIAAGGDSTEKTNHGGFQCLGRNP